ncbi:acetyl-CoA--acetoacetyl-CoA transferase subunit alpha [Rhodococcus aetherivorans]|uniref:acetyl-CoA--acetoacetyl-CoA transferase subunit alpha n=1 Tax=Rhodococcus aetherivorans TaxID=191292 RepID=UPI0002D227D3|nr:acetyl-CoA--acetoacetyl-CoA transferase subunit alpha [Rhodococcus aetherivorans]AKE88374.1 CoA-transferase [Rhodococcus aetherivorans]CCW14767.1 Acetyl-CoA:acetoacetyl-CoA transferase, alpha subunit [Rhodococcus aetherivorans]
MNQSRAAAAASRYTLMTAAQAVREIAAGSTIALTGSGGGILEPDTILEALETCFQETGSPSDLTIVHALGIGDRVSRGTNHLAHKGMIKRVIGGHWTWSPTMIDLVRNDEIEAYAWPGGAISQLLREIGARRPGLITATGLDTFVDPRQGGGKFTASATEDLVELITLDGREYLRYKPFPVDVAIVRGDAIDPAGNITCAGEAAQLDALAVAQAAKASGGRVIAQVKTRLDHPIDPRLVHIPAVLVDVVVHAPAQWQTYASEFDPELSGDAANCRFSPGDNDDIRMLIARRAATEVDDGDVLNVGFGVSALVVDALAEQDRLDDVTLAIEQGLIDGIPVSGDLFGAARGPRVVHSSTTQFDLFAGGLLDVSCLGMAQVDATGAVNVSKIGGGIVGPGGFIDISQNSPRVVFCGTFTARGLDVEIIGGELVIRREGSVPKFVERVDQITYSGHLAAAQGREAVYITERAVFVLTPDGLELTEIAPGIDIDRDILPHMGFRPIINNPRTMDPGLFAPVAAHL